MIKNNTTKLDKTGFFFQDFFKMSAPDGFQLSCPRCSSPAFLKQGDYDFTISSKCDNAHNLKDMPIQFFYNQSMEYQLTCKTCNYCGLQQLKQKSKDIFNYCLNCKIYICSKCIKKHNKIKGNEGHKVINSDLRNTYCEKHLKSFRAFCKNCCENLCEECTNSEKHNKNSHEVLDYEDIIPGNNQVNELRMQLQKRQNEFFTAIKVIETFLDSLLERFETLKEAMKIQVLINEQMINSLYTEEGYLNQFNYQNIININIAENKFPFDAFIHDINALKKFDELNNFNKDDDEDDEEDDFMKNDEHYMRIKNDYQRLGIKTSKFLFKGYIIMNFLENIFKRTENFNKYFLFN